MLENLVEFLKEKGEKHQAISLLETLEKHAFSFDEYDSVAKSFFKIKEYERAIKSALNAYLTAYSNDLRWTSRYNLINVYNHANYPELAMKYIKQAEISIQDNIEISLEKAYSYFLLNQKDKAETLLSNILLNSENLPEEYENKIKFNLGTYYMYRDEFQKGLSLFLNEGKKLEFWKSVELPLKIWDKIPQKGKDIVICAEAGIGDEIINVRFLKYLKEKGMNPIWYTNRTDLVDVFNRNGFTSVSNLKEIKDEETLYSYSMSLPLDLNLQYENLWYGPYLKSSEEYDKKYEWMNSNKLKIGIRWQGNPDYDQDLHRSIPLEKIYETLKDVDADFYSLQKDNGLEEIHNFPNLIDMERYMESFEDTLSIINKLDIIITSCTSIAHASAAMGKRTIVIVPISAYYIWTHSTKQSPWYGDNVTLLRQQTPRTWDEPLSELKKYF